MKAVYDMGRNMYKFLQGGENITLTGLTLEQSFADQWKVRGETEKKKQEREMITPKENIGAEL